MEILEGDAIQGAVLRSYSRDPRGWSFTVRPSGADGFFDALVTGPTETWRLKLDTIFKPTPLVLGARTEEQVAGATAPLSFGFRRVDQEVAPALLDGSPEGVRRLVELLRTANPVAPAVPGSYVQGPIIFSSRAARSTSDRERAVEERLSAEMKALVMRRYPGYH
ncbi:MAG: hypothetical protein JRM86_05145 [Nitrososphaerota archaeon]|jgi:hypothetical protein|nr:hypothetical protein [Nitrososphaerota archaeon]MDG6966559.1 hypothetical protein [Nitrososphaerota archaeon]MDG6978582.1 hypothetical protein [Nitrososphaerota archaeon]MDG7006301.1 hypothetical protein [Nitrososphaerota archaeon]MDG7020971.1 hypothetical protein [Nitrososphaerota archaeon]